jgi:hypothetical protein
LVVVCDVDDGYANHDYYYANHDVNHANDHDDTSR